jgi:regulatory protein
LADSAYLHALKLLARRELTVKGLRARLLDRGYPSDEIDQAVDHLLETGGLDDARVARTYARTAATVKGRGRLRVMRELYAIGVEKAVAAEALAEVFGEVDERTLIARAIQKKMRGRAKIAGAAEYARLYQYLLRQGFSPAGVTQALRKLGGRADSLE